MNFDWDMPIKLITGAHCVANNQGEFAKLGSKCLIVTSATAGRASGALADVTNALDLQKIEYKIYDKVEQNPSVLGSQTAGYIARDMGAQFIVGIGGGSPLDAAKAAAVFATNTIDALDLFDMQWKNPALPIALIGTTAGTGSEVGPVSVLTTPDNQKRSIKHAQCVPVLTFGDPRYTSSLPLAFTLSTALDALAHALEGYFSLPANDMSDLFALESISITVQQLRLLKDIASVEQITYEMRERLYYSSILAGFTLARCGTCYCHVLGYHLTEQYGFAHGTACAVFLPNFIQQGQKNMPEKAERLFNRVGCSVNELCVLINSLNHHPKTVEMTAQEIDELAQRFATSTNFIRTAPNGYTKQEAVQLLQNIFGC